MSLLYGFASAGLLSTDRVTTIGDNVMSDAIVKTVAMHNEEMDAMMGLFVERTTAATERIWLDVAERLQPLTDDGRPVPTAPAGYYDVGFPLQQAGTSFGWNDVAKAKATVAEVNRRLNAKLNADKRWCADQIMAALLDNGTWTYNDYFKGAITVQPLALASDGVVYLRTDNGTPATDTHHLAQAAAIADETNPFPTIYSEITEHPENGGEIVSLVPTSNLAAVKGLAEFVAVTDSNVRLGANSDVIIGAPDIPLPGELHGYLTDSKIWVCEWKRLPANYVVTVMTEGQRALAMREDEEAELQGFKIVAQEAVFPWWETIYRRRAGWGARNRVGAVVYFVGAGDTTYDVPTGYDRPIA